MWFKDSDGAVVADYNPNAWSIEGEEYQLDQDEKLIGVYGVRNMKKYLSSLGFITIKKLTN